jgi:hypothetical protein
MLGIAAVGGVGCAMLQGKQAAKTAKGAAGEGDAAAVAGGGSRPEKVASITEWEDANGVKPRALYMTVLNRCKERMDMKIADKTPDGKYRDHSSSRSMDPLAKGATGRQARDAIQEYHVGWMGHPTSANYREPKAEKPTIWLRQGPAGDYYEAPIELAYGKAYKLQIDPGCKTVSERKDDEPILGCYHWEYVGKCNHRRESAKAPFGCEPGSFGVEGDVKNCSFTTPEGNECKVYYTGFGAGCDIR